MLTLPSLLLALSAPPAIAVQSPPPLLAPAVAERVADPPRCLQARCLSGEWRIEAMADIPAGQLRVDGDSLPGGGARLQLPDARRDWIKARGSNALVGLQYGLRLRSDPDGSLSVTMEPGYRMQGYAEDGIAGTGPVLRGRLAWNGELAPGVRLSQTTRLETGAGSTYVRNSLLLDVELQPRLTLGSGVETSRDSAVAGRNQTNATLKLRYLF